MILSLVMTIFLVLRSEVVQTTLVRLAADYLSEELKTEIRVRGFYLSLRNGLVVEDVSVLDRRKEVVFSAGKFGVRPGMISFKTRIFNISKVFIETGVVQILTHRGDSALSIQFIVDYFASTDAGAETDSTTAAPWHVSLSSIEIKDTRFHLQDKNEEETPIGMDYTNLDITGINLDIRDVAFEGDTIVGTIRHLAAWERSGIVLHELSGEFRVGPRFLKAHDVKLRTDHSDLSLTFDFLYDEWAAYNDFLNKVSIQAQIEPSVLDLQDIGYFAPVLAVMKDRFKLSGNIRGTVSNFKARDMDIAYGKNTLFRGNISALGLPDIEETFIDLNIKSLTTTKADLESLILPGDQRNLELPPILSGLGLVNLKGYFTGFYNDFVATARLNTAIGKVSTDLSLKKQANSKLIAYKGGVTATGFDVGILTGNPNTFGRVTLKAEVNGVGFDLNEANLTMNVRIDSAFMNGYDYKNISVTGSLKEKNFDGILLVDDPNLVLAFNGSINLQDSIPDYDFSAQIKYADLFKLNLLRRDSIESLTASVIVNFNGTNPDNIDGTVKIHDFIYTEGDKTITLNRLSLLTRPDSVSGKSYHLESDFLDADITGNFSFSKMVPSLTLFIQNYLASFNLTDSLIAPNQHREDQEMHIIARFKQSDEVTAIFLPFLRIAPNSELNGYYNEEKETILLNFKSPSIFLNDIEFTDWSLDAENKADDLSLVARATAVYLKRAAKDDSLEVKVDSFQLVSNIRHDSILYNVGWNARSMASELAGYVSFRNSPVVELKLDRFKVFLNNAYWQVDPENYIVLDSASYRISNLSFNSGEQFLKIDGQLSDNVADSLGVSFNKVDISELDQLLGTSQVDIDGILNGSFKVTKPFTNVMVISDLYIRKFRFNKELLGDAVLKISYDAAASKFDLMSQILYTGNAGTNMPFSLTGSYILDKRNPWLDFDLSLKNLNLKMLQPFVSNFMSGVNGLASGQVKIQGSPDKPNIAGSLSLMRTELKINYLNVPYSFADVIRIDSNAFIFDKITLYDSLGHKSVLNGKITHNNFTDLHLDLHIEMDDFAAFNNTRAQNSVFYGKARASGSASITGPPEDIRITVRASTGGKTHVVIPIDLIQSVGQADYIIFVEPSNDSIAYLTEKPQAKSASGLSLDLGLRVNQDAEVEVFFPDQLGNLKASGTGNLLMSMTPETPFMLSGTYTLTKGFFLFQFRNLLRLPMSIMPGSTISWTGDPADANVSISTVYRTKAPLRGLTTNPEEEGIRIPVECIIRLSGKLMNPDIAFAINLPNVEEGIRTQVFSAIDTNNAVTVTEQAIYLMVMNQFKPVVASSSGVDVGATSLSLVTNQINSMLSQVTTNVNLNMNYKPGSATTSQEFDVGISTQFLDDRLLIDGTFGMNSYTNSSVEQSSTIVGDINVEYILTGNRRWRARAFNRTNTLNILNNNSPYTQGVGIKYQRDFTTFGEFFKIKAKKQGAQDGKLSN